MIPSTPPGTVIEQGISAGDEWITIGRSEVRAVLQALKDQGYHSYLFMTAVDHLATPVQPPAPERFELVYQLRNLERRQEIRVRVFIPGDDPRADSVADIFKPANWDERETWDLFGIVFERHPGLTRILLPDEWEGHPLRRDYPVGGERVDFSEDHDVWQSAPPEA